MVYDIYLLPYLCPIQKNTHIFPNCMWEETAASDLSISIITSVNDIPILLLHNKLSK